MLKNNFYKNDIEKYRNITSMYKSIIKCLKKYNKPLSYEKLIYNLNIKNNDQLKILNNCLNKMKLDNKLIITCNKYFLLSKKTNMLIGTVNSHRDGYGFLQIKEYEDDFYISSKEMKNCIHGDQVLAKLLRLERKGHYEVKIVRILTKNRHRIIGRYFNNESNKMGFVIPNDSRFSFKIFIPLENLINVNIGSIVVTEIIKRPTKSTKAIGKIVKILSNDMNINIAINTAIHNYKIPFTWSKSVKEQIKTFKTKKDLLKDSKVNRVDLRNLPFITIDDCNAYDFDDAVYCKKQKNGIWCLWVAIADVSYYVRPGTPLDNEARNRGVSIYFPLKVIPMLPEILSNNLCSLKPNLDRLCLICEINVSETGKIIDFRFYEAIIQSHARLTYLEVWYILQGNEKLNKRYAPFIELIKELYNLYQILYNARKKRGSIDFKNEEVRFIFNSNNHIERIEQVLRNDACKIIEECMILANISAAKFIERKRGPALFRVHEKPSIDVLSNLRNTLANFGLILPNIYKIKSYDYIRLLESIIDRHDNKILKIILLRSMKQAFYNSENLGHFGLNLKSYAHFTSPIRRYSDLSLHRIIKHLIRLENNKLIKNKNKTTGEWCYSIKEVTYLGKHCSMIERRAEHAIHDVTDWLKCNFMLNQIGNKFYGIIYKVTYFGFFVYINEIFIEGLVHISSLDNDQYKFNPLKQCLIGLSYGRIYCLGDCVEVKLNAVNMEDRKINFILYK